MIVTKIEIKFFSGVTAESYYMDRAEAEEVVKEIRQNKKVASVKLLEIIVKDKI